MAAYTDDLKIVLFFYFEGVKGHLLCHLQCGHTCSCHGRKSVENAFTPTTVNKNLLASLVDS
jgi:hypothetical protein